MPIFLGTRIPDEGDAGAREEIPVAGTRPTAATGVPVPVAGEDTTVFIETYDNGDVSIAAGALHIWLQYDDGVDMRRA